MKVRDIIPDDRDYRIVNVVNHLKKKKKANPKKAKTKPMANFIDVFGGMAGYGDPGANNDNGVIQ